jgi:hypothetical protein
VLETVSSPWDAALMTASAQPSGPRLSAVVIDVPESDHARAVEFWSAALGRRPLVTARYPEYAQFEDATPGLALLVQATSDDTRRVHLDLDSSDPAADVARLIDLGAEVIERHDHWVVMRDTAGAVFCVIGPQPRPVEAP